MAISHSKESERLTLNALSKKIPMARSQLETLLAHPDAPKGVKRGKYVTYRLAEVLAYIPGNTKWAKAGLSPDARSMKDRMIALDLEEKEATAALRRGETVGKKAVIEAYRGLTAQLYAMFRKKYVDELPPKFPGKNQAECRALCEAGFNEVATSHLAQVEKAETKIGPTVTA